MGRGTGASAPAVLRPSTAAGGHGVRAPCRERSAIGREIVDVTPFRQVLVTLIISLVLFHRCSLLVQVDRSTVPLPSATSRSPHTPENDSRSASQMPRGAEAPGRAARIFGRRGTRLSDSRSVMAKVKPTLRERVGKPVNYDNLAQSLSISPPTAKSWVELLEKLYLIFLLPPYSNRLSRSIRKDRRIYFFDCAAAYDETGGAQLENLVACSLLKYAQFRKDAVGESWEIFYLRDKESREVDFVVTFNRRVHWLVEVKASDNSPGTSLRYYTDKLRPHESLQLVLNLDRAQEKSGIKILPLGKWLEELPFQRNAA